MRLKTILIRGAVFVLALLPVLQTFPAGAVAIFEKPSLESLEYSLDKNTKKATFISAGRDEILPLNSQALTEAEPTAVARQVIKEYGTFFGLRDPLSELSLFKEQIDRVGMTHVRYNQQYQGVPVFGGQIIVHLDKDGLAKSLNGKVVPNVELNTKPKVSAEAAIAKAREIWKEQFGLDEAEVIKSDLYVLNQSLIDKRFEDKNYLVWRVELRQDKPAKDEFYFVDAESGELIYQLTGIKNAIDRQIWDCSAYGFIGGCGLDYPWLSYTYGRSEGQSARGTNPWYGNTDVDDLYTIVNSCHSYVYGTFGIDGANGYGGIGDGLTHGGLTYALTETNVWSYIDGYGYSCPNAYSNDYEIGFCYGMVVTDVVAHEYGHSILEFAVPDIPYTSEPGAVHEAYADITGEAVEYYRNGSNDWLNGADITLVSSTPRSLISPGDYDDGLGNNPATYYSDDFYCGSSDNYGVHHNSTVISHAAYLMAMGGTQSGCTVTAIGRAKQEQIFYQAITNYITAAVDFNQVYDALNLACNDLYSAADCAEVEDALQAVELDQEGACSGVAETTPECALSLLEGSAIAANNSNGDLHIVANKSDGTLQHTVRHADGSWQSGGWGDLTTALGSEGMTDYAPAVAYDSTNDKLHLVIVGQSDEHILHTVRSGDGSWQSQGWGDVSSGLAGSKTADAAPAVAVDSNTGELQIAIKESSTNHLLHTVRYSNGSWQSQGWGDVTSVLGSDETTTVGPAIAYDSDNQNLQVLMVASSDNHLLHTVRYSDGSWQAQGWGDVTAYLSGDKTTTLQPAITLVTGQGEVQMAIVDGSGHILHTVRYGSGAWQSQGWGDVTSVVGGDKTTNKSVGLSYDSTLSRLHITMIDLATTHFLHTLRYNDGSWQSQGWGDVTSVLGE